LRRMDKVICVSESVRGECLKRGVEGSRLRVISNGVDTRPLNPDKNFSAGELDKRNISIPGEAKVLLTVGRLVKRKGVAEFIENVFPGLVKERPDIAYLVVGSGEQAGNIKNLITRLKLQNNVFLTGTVSEKLLWNLYAFSDLFIMPNIEVEGDMEGFGIVAREASARGLPVVASDIEGIKDAVKDGQNGYLISPDSPELFREKILRLLEDDSLREGLAEKAKEFVSGYSWSKVASRYLEEAKDTARYCGKNIFMISRAIEPPWDEASRNLVRDIVSHVDDYNFHVLTTGPDAFEKENVFTEKIYSSRENDLTQKMRLFLFLLKRHPGLHHFCFTPEPATSSLIRLVAGKNKMVQSIPYLTSRISGKKCRDLIYSDVVTVTSQYTKDILERSGVKGVQVVYPGVDTTQFSPAIDKGEAKKRFFTSNGFYVLYAGDISSKEVIRTMRDIVYRTCSDEKDIIFVIPTARTRNMKKDSSWYFKLKKEIEKVGLEDSVIILPPSKVNGMMHELMAACDCLIYPFFEGFRKKIDIPYVIVEAMSSGMPVIVSDTEPINEVIVDGAGLAVSGGAGEFANKIKMIFNDRGLYRSLSEKNREAALRYFDVKKSAEKFREIYRSLLG
ncbi:MAG: glycosyltransferase family 4 protein, partial [Candidatus Omnitrophota bacterium]